MVVKRNVLMDRMLNNQLKEVGTFCGKTKRMW